MPNPDQNPEPKKAVQAGRWIQDPMTGKLIPASEYRASTPQQPEIMKPLEAFKSPIDGSEIRDRSQLRRHNQQHGVTDYRDYGDAYFARKAREREAVFKSESEQFRRERRQAIAEAFKRHQ